MTDAWLHLWFLEIEKSGKPSRRKISNIRKCSSMRAMEVEVRRRSWHLVISAGYATVFPDPAPLELRC